MDNWIYEKDLNNKSRFVLGTKGQRSLICIGINPSTAAPNYLDNTLKSVERISIKHGFDSWLMLNIYPQRSTDPKGLHKKQDEKIHQNNLIHIERIFADNNPAKIWAAWGTLISTRPYLKLCLLDIYKVSSKYNYEWLTIGRQTKDGHPHHPLYLNSNLLLTPFDINTYLKSTTAQQDPDLIPVFL